MIELLLLLFLASSLWMVLWGVVRPERYYQFPMLTGAVWLLFIGPMAIGIYNNRDWLPDGVEQDGGIEMALFVGFLCCIASYLGYVTGGRSGRTSEGSAVYSDDRMFLCGVFFIMVAYWAFLQLAALSGGLSAYFSVDGSYKLEWVGLPVAYAFFAQLIYPGIILCFFAYLGKKTPVRLGFIAFGLIMPFANVLLRGRRSELAALLVTLAFCFFFRKRWVPPKAIVVGMLLFGAFAVLAAPVYREHSQLGGDRAEIWNISPEKLLTSMLSGNEYTELHYAVVQLPATYQENEYNYGRGFYNRFVRQWVPKMFVGEKVKAAMFWPGPNFKLHTMEYYGWAPQNGWIPTAIVDVFREFSFFGALLFFLLGRGFRWLWDRADRGDYGAQIFYIALAPSAMYAVVSGVTAFTAQLIFLLIFLTPVLWFCRSGRVLPVRKEGSYIPA